MEIEILRKSSILPMISKVTLFLCFWVLFQDPGVSTKTNFISDWYENNNLGLEKRNQQLYFALFYNFESPKLTVIFE